LDGKKVASSLKGGDKFAPEQFYLTDHLGTSSLVLNQQARAVSAQRFTPFGDRLALFGKSQATPYGFTGQEQDDESDLGYFSHRYLAHSSAQFVTPDPVFAQSERFENPQHWSAYSYGINNPIRYTDPSGEIPFDTIWDGLNIVYDLGKVGVGYATNNPVMVNDGLVDLACDTAALLIPYAPAGSTKMARLSSDVADVTNSASFGASTSKNYKKTFFDANPDAKGNVVVHHAVEQQVQKRYPGLVSDSQMHSLENLRGIPKSINSDVHLSKIRKEWNRFYRSNAKPSQQQLLDKATEIDNKFGSQFNPPIR
jgi:RHS repeat-associated protein